MTIAPRLADLGADTPASPVEQPALASPLWPDAPLPRSYLRPLPGLGTFSLAGTHVTVTAILVLGLSGAALERAVGRMADLQAREANFVPLFITDSTDQKCFRERGYTFEYLPPSRYRLPSGRLNAAAVKTRLEVIKRKWAIQSAVDLSDTADLGAGADLVRDRPPKKAVANTGDTPPLEALLAAEDVGSAEIRAILDLVDSPELSEPGQPADDAIRKRLRTIRRLARAAPQGRPTVSIVIPVHNQLGATLLCLHSILRFPPRCAFEIIVGNDRSTDDTAVVVAKAGGPIRLVNHDKQLGFLRNCNEAARSARGRFLVLLNNDTIVLPGALDAVVDTIAGNEAIGIAGARLVYPDGKLQEAGGFIFEDGTAWNFGRGQDPSDSAYTYVRDADYCSAAALAIRADLWTQLGGFDERYVPAYYEDTDLAMRVRAAGLRVTYQPASIVIHHEGVSYGHDRDGAPKQAQLTNRETFRQRWQDELPAYGARDAAHLPAGRWNRGTILAVDAETPRPDNDSGSIDTYEYLRMLTDWGYRVIFCPENFARPQPYSRALNALGVETLCQPYWTNLHDVLQHFGAEIDIALLWRASVAANAFDLVRKHAPKAKVIFSTVDLHFLRLERQATLSGLTEDWEKAAAARKTETGLIRDSDATIVVSPHEAALLRETFPQATIAEIPILRTMPPKTKVGFASRRNIVFIGGFRHPPNVDAVLWFAEAVMPILRRKGFRAKFVVAGSHMPRKIAGLRAPGVEVRGFVPDLAGFFDAARVSVAPLRFGAGQKGKIVTSLGMGVPVVATTIGAEGMSLKDRQTAMIADDPEAIADRLLSLYRDEKVWRRLSNKGYAFCNAHFSVDAVAPKVRGLLDQLLDDGRPAATAETA